MIEDRILVVEDDPSIRKHLARAMKRQVRHVDEAGDGEEALRLFTAQPYPLVILDLRLPKMDGVEVLKSLRKLGESSQVVVISGHGNKDDVIAALNLHAYKFFEKPMNLDDVELTMIDAYKEYSSREERRLPALSNAADDMQIIALYERLNKVSLSLDKTPDDVNLRQEYQSVLQELRGLQEQEAKAATEAFRQSLPLSKGEGYGVLESARKLLKDA